MQYFPSPVFCLRRPYQPDGSVCTLRGLCGHKHQSMGLATSSRVTALRCTKNVPGSRTPSTTHLGRSGANPGAGKHIMAGDKRRVNIGKNKYV